QRAPEQRPRHNQRSAPHIQRSYSMSTRAKGSRMNYCGGWSGVDGVVPVGLEVLAGDVHCGQLGVADLDPLLVLFGVKAGVDGEPGAGGCRGDQVDNHLEAAQRPSAPVEAHEAEQAMLNFVPLAGSRREVADADREPELVGELLQLDLPQPSAAAVRAA